MLIDLLIDIGDRRHDGDYQQGSDPAQNIRIYIGDTLDA